MLGRRVAVTGIGVVAPAGIGKEAFWSGLLSPAPNGFRQIEDWDPSPYFDNPKEARRSDRVSQFTLAADTRRGRRPSFSSAAPPALAEPLYEAFLDEARRQHRGAVEAGRFGADMKVALVNDGPLTFWLEG